MRNRKLIGSGLLAIFCQGAGLGLTFLLSLFISRYFGIQAMGLVALATTIGIVIGYICNLGLMASMTKWVAENIALDKPANARQGVTKAYSFTFALGILVTACFIGVLIITKSPISDPYPLPVFAAIMTGSMLINISIINTAALKGMKLSWQAVACEVVPTPLFTFILIAGYILIIGPLPFSHYVFLWMSAALLTNILRRAYWVSQAPKATSNSEVTLSTILTFARPFFFASIITLGLNQIDNLMLGILATKEELGGYAVAFRLAQLISIFQTVTNSFTSPRLAEHMALRNNMKAIEVASKSATYITSLAGPTALFFIIFGSLILGIWGEEFKDFYPVLCLLVGAQFINVACGPSARMLLYGEYTTLRNSIAFLALLVDTALNYVLIPPLGALGSAIATAIAIVLMNSLSWLFVGLKYGKFILIHPRYILQLIKKD